MATSPAVEAAVADWTQRLGRVYRHIAQCRVWIDQPNHHRQRGAEFAVRIHLSIPGGEIAVAHDSGHTDVYVALAEAFSAARRQLLDRIQAHRDAIHERTGA